MDRRKSLGFRHLYYDTISTRSDLGKVDVKTDYEDEYGSSKGDENSQAQLASTCVAGVLVFCA